MASNIPTHGYGRRGGTIPAHGYGAGRITTRVPDRACILIGADPSALELIGADPTARVLRGADPSARVLIGGQEPC